MSEVTRRDALKFAAAAGVAGVAAVVLPTPAAAEGFLEGKWVVRCFGKGNEKHDDTVTRITRNHDCSKCGRKSVNEGAAHVVCPDGHASLVSGITRNHICPEPVGEGKLCGKECKR